MSVGDVSRTWVINASRRMCVDLNIVTTPNVWLL